MWSTAAPAEETQLSPFLRNAPSWPTNAWAIWLIFRHVNNRRFLYATEVIYDCYTFLLWLYLIHALCFSNTWSYQRGWRLVGLSSVLSLSSSFQTFTTSPSNSSDLHVHILLITLFHCLSPILCPSQLLPFFLFFFFTLYCPFRGLFEGWGNRDKYMCLIRRSSFLKHSAPLVWQRQCYCSSNNFYFSTGYRPPSCLHLGSSLGD